MDGHARTVGRLFQTLTVGEQTYTLRAPPIGRLIADMEAYIVSLRRNPFLMAAEACHKLPDTIAPDARTAMEERVWKAAEAASVRCGAVSAAEMDEFTASPRGLAYQLLTCLEADHGAEIQTVDDALSLLERYVEEAGEDGLLALRAKVLTATGEADAKNSSGPSRKRPGKAKQKDCVRKSRDGRASISTSPGNTGTRRSK